jgi:hypothetical protein
MSRQMAWIYLRIERDVLSGSGVFHVSSARFRKYPALKIATKGNE